MPLCGGLSEVFQGDEHVQKLVDGLKHELKAKIGDKPMKEMKVVSYKKQIVAGVNYFVKVVEIVFFKLNLKLNFQSFFFSFFKGAHRRR